MVICTENIFKIKKVKNYFYSVALFIGFGAMAQTTVNNPFTVKWDNGFKVESADQQFKLKFGGRIMVDHAFFSHDTEMDANYGALEAYNGTEFRRARFYMSGTVYDNVDFKFQLDFGSGKTAFKDVYIGIKKIPYVGNIRVGHFKEPFRLEVLTSSKYITFMERSLITDVNQERNNGLMVFNEFLGNDKVANDEYAVDGRITGLVLDDKEKRKYIHIGAAYSHRKKNAGQFLHASRPEAHLGEAYISTGLIENVNTINLLNFEGVVASGPFSLQGEYLTSKVETGGLSTFKNYSFSSYYLQASYFITGEHRKLKGSYDGFDRVKPRNNFGNKQKGAGAWEVALRYSNADLNSGDVFGGQQADVTLGLNWYLNPVTRVMLNHVWGNVENLGKVNVFQMRFQIDF